MFEKSIVDALLRAPYMNKDNYKSHIVMYFSLCEDKMTFWTRFAASTTALGKQVKAKGMFTLRPASSIKFCGNPQSDSKSGWRGNICKCCEDALLHISRHPDIYTLQVCTGGWGG